MFDGYYREMHGLTRVFGFVALMALLISCMGLFGLAALLATPASYLLIESLMDSIYAYHAPLTAAPFFLACALVFLTAALTVSTQVRKFVTVHPAHVLHDD